MMLSMIQAKAPPVSMDSGDFWINATDDSGTDRVTFEGTGELVLGAKDDTLIFLWMAVLPSVGKNVVESMFLVGKNLDEPGEDMDVEEVGVAHSDDAFSKASQRIRCGMGTATKSSLELLQFLPYAQQQHQ